MGKMDELIAHVSERTYAYGAIRAENQNLLDTISELKARTKNGENGMNATSSVKRPKSRDSHVKTSVLDVSKNEAKKEAVYNVIDVAVANASKAKTLLCVSCMQNVLIPCHDKCVSKHKLNVRSNARRTFSDNSRIPKSSETTFVAPKTSVGIYNGTQDCFKFQDIWSSTPLADVMQDILQVLDYTRYGMGPTAIADNANSPGVLKKVQRWECSGKSGRGYKDTEVEPDKDTPMVDVTNIVPPINVDDEEDEITDEVFELRRRVKGKNVEETRISPIPSPSRSPRNLYLLDLQQQHQLYLAIKADPLLQQQDIAIWLALQMKFEKTQRREISAKKAEKDMEYEAYVSGESSSGQVNVEEPGPSTSGLLWSQSVFIRSSMIWERVHDFQLGIKSYQQKINLTAPIITFPGIEEYDVFSIVYEPVHGIIYTNSKKEKRVMRHSEIHKFCDATLRRTLEGLKSYYNDVKYGYVQKELTNDEVEFLKLFEEEIEVQLNYQDQMRRCEMYVNGRPLGPRRDRLE
ncbi:hypothetical protein Tco_0318912 [Tanacetum coccineum]